MFSSVLEIALIALSYLLFQNVKQLGGFHIPGQNISIDDHRGHLETYLKVLNKVNNEKFLMMSQRINELLLKVWVSWIFLCCWMIIILVMIFIYRLKKCSQTLQSISKLERERKSSAQSKVEALKNILRTSLVSLYTWTRNVKKSVKQLDEKINDLTQKVRKKSTRFSLDLSKEIDYIYLCKKTLAYYWQINTSLF